jgi:putative FmdB family regulatory protein
MPLYEYECTACHKRTEKIQKFSDPEITVCPRCGGALERVLSAPAISFKGGGWYADGYGNARPSASSTESTGSGESSGSSGSGGSSDGGGASESKPAASKTGDSATSSTPAAAPATAASPAPAPGKG